MLIKNDKKGISTITNVDDVKTIIIQRIDKLKKSRPNIDSIPNKRRIHPALKQWKGRLLESKYILKLINKLQNDN